MNPDRKPIIGLAGGIGAGKSMVAGMLADLGARVIHSDRLSHEVLNLPAVCRQIVEWWGPAVIGQDGLADRQVIRRLVQEQPEQLRKLEQLLHPRIAERSAELIAGWQADPRVQAIIWDAPLLFEADLAKYCDCVIFVDSDLDTRLKRVRESRGWTAEDLKRLEASQSPLALKRDRSQYIVNNNTDVGSLRRQVEAIFSQILSGP